MDYAPGDVVWATFRTANPTTGAVADASSTPTASLVRNGAVDGAVSCTVTDIGTGLYSVTATLPGGYAAGDHIAFAVDATVASVAVGGVVRPDARLRPAGLTVQTVSGNVNGSVGSVTGNVGGNVAGSVGSVVGAVGSVTSPVAVGSIATNAVNAAALAADAVAEIAGAVWDEARGDHTTIGTFGQGVASVQGSVTGNVGGSIGSIVGVSFPANFGTTLIDGSGRVTVGAMAADTVNAAALAADAVAEIAAAVGGGGGSTVNVTATSQTIQTSAGGS